MLSVGDNHWKCSISSAASIAMLIDRFFGEWNGSHLRACINSATRCLSSFSVVFESDKGFSSNGGGEVSAAESGSEQIGIRGD